MLAFFAHPYVLIVGGLVGLFIGGELFVRGAVNLGRRLGLSELFVGLAIVGFGTSAAELAVSIDAALQGSSDIALANVVGSNIANIALVLGITAVIKSISVDAQSFRRDIPVLLFASVVLLVMLLDGTLTRYEGAGLLLGLVAYLSFAAWHTRQQTTPEDDFETIDRLPTVLGMLIAGVGLLVIGSHWLVDGAITVSLQLGITEAVVGVTVVAIGTCLPEITVSVVAALRGKTDLALGNIVGSNIWNILAVLGSASVIVDLPRGNVGWDMLGFFMIVTLMLTYMAKTAMRISRIEGVVLLCVYALVQTWVVSTGVI